MENQIDLMLKGLSGEKKDNVEQLANEPQKDSREKEAGIPLVEENKIGEAAQHDAQALQAEILLFQAQDSKIVEQVRMELKEKDAEKLKSIANQIRNAGFRFSAASGNAERLSEIKWNMTSPPTLKFDHEREVLFNQINEAYRQFYENTDLSGDLLYVSSRIKVAKKPAEIKEDASKLKHDLDVLGEALEATADVVSEKFKIEKNPNKAIDDVRVAGLKFNSASLAAGKILSLNWSFFNPPRQEFDSLKQELLDGIKEGYESLYGNIVDIKKKRQLLKEHHYSEIKDKIRAAKKPGEIEKIVSMLQKNLTLVGQSLVQTSEVMDMKLKK